jgi:hypothetical protein
MAGKGLCYDRIIQTGKRPICLAANEQVAQDLARPGTPAGSKTPTILGYHPPHGLISLLEIFKVFMLDKWERVRYN